MSKRRVARCLYCRRQLPDQGQARRLQLEWFPYVTEVPQRGPWHRVCLTCWPASALPAVPRAASEEPREVSCE